MMLINTVIKFENVIIYIILFYFLCRLCKDLEIKCKHNRSLNTSFNRILTKHEYKEELDELNLGGKLVDYETPTNIKNEEDATSTYGYLNKRRPINLLSYKEDYKHRYAQKKGLAKLDCYYEKILFDRIDDMHVLVKSMRNDKKLLRKELYNKFGIRFILFSLIPALGLIFPILFGFRRGLPGILGACPNNHFRHIPPVHRVNDDLVDIKNCTTKWIFYNKDTINQFGYVSYIFSFIMATIVLLVSFYILIKIIKYEKIKAGKGKMNIKEYYRFCKNLL